MNKKNSILLIIGLSISSMLFAQQTPIINQYLFNKYAISPAYAGLNNNIESFIGYRQNWAGIQGSPTLESINFNIPYQRKMGLGISINNQQTGNFKHFSTDLTYAYHLQIGRSDSYLNFGMNAKLYRNQLDLSTVTSQGVDPLISESNTLVTTTFDAAAAVMFNTADLYVGISVPQIIGLAGKYNGSDGTYTMARQAQFHVSYVIEPHKTLYIEPMAVVRYGFGAPIQFDVSALVKFKQRMWTALHYHHGSGVGLSIGGAISDGIVINYSYEAGISGISKMSSGSHEFSMGFLIKRAQKRTMPTIFPPSESENNEKKNRELERKFSTMEKKLKKEVEQRQTEIENLRKRLDEIQKGAELSADVQEMNDYEKPFVLENIRFGNNSERFFPSSYPSLDKIATKMAKNPDLEIMILGYTDNKGSAVYNQRLSERRAKAVYTYLIGKGVTKNRIKFKGLGDKNPRASNATTDGRAQNRRIEAAFKK